MGIYFNPGNDSFKKDKNSELYLDKTGLLEHLNRVICTNANCISVSHARRFGKSHAAGMIDAYYSRGCDSSELFENTEIATKPGYREHMNQYQVIHIDVSSFWDVYRYSVCYHYGRMGLCDQKWGKLRTGSQLSAVFTFIV